MKIQTIHVNMEDEKPEGSMFAIELLRGDELERTLGYCYDENLTEVWANSEELLKICKELIYGHGFNEGNLDNLLDSMEISVKSLSKIQKILNKIEGK